MSKMETVKLLIFSDIHSDAKALERLMATAADYYFCAGDLVNWSRGLDAMGEILETGGGTTVFDFVEKSRVGLKGRYGEKVIWVPLPGAELL